MIASGTIVGGRYRVVQILGGGGMKLVYLAEDQRLADRRCALAEMVDSFTSPDAQQSAVAAFQREADMLAQLSNEHIPRIIDRFSEANRHYLVMEYIDGITLEDELKQSGGKLAPDVVVNVAIQILDTLEYLHGLSPPVIYRDLKPSNVMITAAGLAKLIDFGIARFFAPLSNATMIGTQGYAPPEQYRGKVDARSDLYALGATMHHALSGRDPAAEAPFSFPPLRKIAPAIDSTLAVIVDQALTYDATRRITDASEFRRRLLELHQAASARPAAVSSGKAQLQLPLGGNPSAEANAQAPTAPVTPVGPPPQPPASAPTVITAHPEIRCPRCARMIPADSRFCSYCSAPLRAGAGEVANPADATVILSPAPSGGAESKSPRRRPRRRRQRGPLSIWHRPLPVIAIIFVAGFIVMRQITRALYDSQPPAGYDSGAPGNSGAAAPDSNNLSSVTQMRLLALRQALDARGYDTVRVRMNGDLLVLSGTIPSEDDRAMVQQICMLLQFPYLKDNLRVAPGPG